MKHVQIYRPMQLITAMMGEINLVAADHRFSVLSRANAKISTITPTIARIIFRFKHAEMFRFPADGTKQIFNVRGLMIQFTNAQMLPMKWLA
jgi:hypothetical protein